MIIGVCGSQEPISSASKKLLLWVSELRSSMTLVLLCYVNMPPFSTMLHVDPSVNPAHKLHLHNIQECWGRQTAPSKQPEPQQLDASKCCTAQFNLPLSLRLWLNQGCNSTSQVFLALIKTWVNSFRPQKHRSRFRTPVRLRLGPSLPSMTIEHNATTFCTHPQSQPFKPRPY